MLCRWALIFFSGGVLDICLPALPPGQQEKQTLHPDLPHPRQNAAGLCAQQLTLATASDNLVAHACQNAAGLCADQQQFHCSTLFCFYLIPIKMLLVCVDINNLQCRTLFYLILVRMLLVYVLVNNSLFSYFFFFTSSPSVCCQGVRYA